MYIVYMYIYIKFKIIKIKNKFCIKIISFVIAIDAEKIAA